MLYFWNVLFSIFKIKLNIKLMFWVKGFFITWYAGKRPNKLSVLHFKCRSRIRNFIKVVLHFNKGFNNPLLEGTSSWYRRQDGNTMCRCNDNQEEQHGPWSFINNSTSKKCQIKQNTWISIISDYVHNRSDKISNFKKNKCSFWIWWQ